MALWDLFRREKQPEPHSWLALPHQTLPNCSPQELMELWKLADREKGVPLLIRLDDTLEHTLRETIWPEGPLPDLEPILSPAIEAVQSREELSWVLGQPGAAAGAIDRFMSFSFHEANDVVLAFVPAEEPWNIFRHLPVGGWNNCPPANVMAAFCRELYRDFGAVPAVLTGDTLELVPARRPSHEEAFPLALKMYAFCPDIVTQGLGSVWALASCLEQSDVWYFWWDQGL